MPTYQDQFQAYLNQTYFPNDPSLQGNNMNVVEPTNTFDISPELKKKLKKQRKEISPVRQYANDTVQFDETTGTGQFDFSDPFKLFNIAAQGITGFANANNDAKNRRLEEQMYLQALMPKPSFNYNEDGLNNIPMYKTGGKKEPSPEKAREMLHNPPGGKKLTEKQRKYFGYLASKKAQYGMNVNDWHHNVDNIPFPPISTEIPRSSSRYFQDQIDTSIQKPFIGPANYPAGFRGTNDMQWNFTPVRVDYNKQYVPYQKYSATNTKPYILKKDLPVVTEIINTINTIGTTPQPTPQSITGKKVFLDPNNPTLANPQNDIWNNPSDIPPWYKDGGYNEGDEMDLSDEEIKKMQSAGFRFEIL